MPFWCTRLRFAFFISVSGFVSISWFFQASLWASTSTTADVEPELTTRATTTTTTSGLLRILDGRASRWKFDFLKLQATNSKRCPKNCDASTNNTCGRCIRIGNEVRGPGIHTRVFQISNVFYDHGFWFHSVDEEDMFKCVNECYPTWDAANSYFFRPWDYFKPQKRVRPAYSCTPSDMIMEPALLVRWFSPHWTANPFHFYSDTLLSVFMTAGHIAKMFGCPQWRLHIYLVDGWPLDFEGHRFSGPVFPDAWKYFFGKMRTVDKMKGCYKHVFYGHAYKSVPQFDWRATVYDATLSSWMFALGLSMREGLVPLNVLTSANHANSAHMLFVSHWRAPNWFHTADWNVTGLELRSTSFEKMPYKEQISAVAASRGLLGLAGSGMAQQLFLRPRSLVGYVATLEAVSWDKFGERCCALRMRRKSKIPDLLQPEENALNYVTMAINVGNSALLWRWCRPDIFDNSARFTSENAKAVTKLLLSLDGGGSSHISVCLVLNNTNLSSPTWPQCDQHIVKPVAPVIHRCSPYGYIGVPYDPKLNSSFLTHESAVQRHRFQFTPYCGGHVSGKLDKCTYKHACR